MTVLLVALGGALGATLRHGLAVGVGQRGFPVATLLVNASGTFALAVLVNGSWSARLDPAVLAGLAVGVLGGFTTYSAFGNETLQLLRDGRLVAAGLYAFGTLGLGLLSAAAGWALARTSL
jgi:CrcB protein